MDPARILPHHHYSNGAYGRAWGVRLVTALHTPSDGEPTVSFRGMAGTCRRKTATVRLAEFAAWAKYEVALNENSWQRVEPAEHDE